MALHTITSDKFPQNPDIWGRELSEKLEIETFLFNDHYGWLQEREFSLEPGEDFAGIPRFDNKTSDERKAIVIETLINNTFLSMFREVVVYIDKVLSLYLWTKQTQENPIPYDQIEDIDAFLLNQPIEEYKKLTRDQTYTFPKKLKILSTLNKRSLDRLNAYNDIRVAFEHHGGIAKKDIALPLSKIENNDNLEGLITTNLRLDTTEDLLFSKDTKIKLMPQDVTVIGFDMRGWIIKDILLAIDALDKN